MGGIETDKKFVTCPECGEELESGTTQVTGHLRDHWNVDLANPYAVKNPDARKRIRVLLEHLPSQVVKPVMEGE